ncbi:rRNA biogenesis protein RRP36 [Cryptococcus neoformans]|uniref:rRNA biogenesis protein RRP36 n=1 Tax=Cryptococcus neoformans Tu259-1 TaxID=1230072 RepID=A0A854Q953_CRYNE|nr:rRNA biogenesis protein RRP36 [Cryptococcus neoformans var. grubii Tu259-1]OXG47931.1 rRNA biogenesis protein RRP36 [Cryptococcus neoformans var. grubii Th84]OXG76977.1 rRNA biogenesis protein RRP36 [Cryptococcus neoformans var. grubii MW-RSA36]OXH06557.1 rRNA biogenesis protein RRP36 [Cryptococcus neoformans var. grubii]OXL06865.1 rRNA biogenesis protein RRP36 [Cryptococcus neoformans var. grubii Gb118]
MTTASSSKASGAACRKQSEKTVREPSPDDEFLELDSEVDEFAEGFQPGLAEKYSDDDDDDEDEENDRESYENEESGEEGNARWEPDNWDENGDTVSESGSDDGHDESAELRKLQNNLNSLPLSTLAKAQKSLSRKSSSSSSNGQSKEEKLALMKSKLAQMQRSKGKAVAAPEIDSHRFRSRPQESDEESDSGPETTSSTKRGSKHAPAAMSTKKQVSRKRQVIEVPKPERRDPRFSSVSAGHANADLHSKSYSFLPDLLRQEFSGLKEAVAAAKKAEKNCSWAEKPMKTAERERLEVQMGQVRTKLVRTEKESMEREILAKAKKEEREKRTQGKGAWYMKKGEKKDLLLKARFETLEKQGGKTAVKKLVEKKRKKLASKEKKSRPFAKGAEGMGRDTKKRRIA